MKHQESKISLKSSIDGLRDEVDKELKKEIERLEKFVQQATEKVNSNNDGIYEKYDEKLKKIKDVCA